MENPFYCVEVCASYLGCHIIHSCLHSFRHGMALSFEKQQLSDTGLSIQLEHGGCPCPCLIPGPLDCVVFHVNGVHQVNVDYCDCGT